MKINNPSTQLLVEALRTIPVIPRFSLVTFQADGIQPVQEEGTYYRALCKRNRIIPYSELCLAPSKIIPSRNLPQVSCWSQYTQTGENPALGEDLIEGGRFQTIQVRTDESQYPAFVWPLMATLEQTGYKIEKGELALFDNNITPVNIVRLGDFKQPFGCNGLELIMDSDVHKNPKRNLINWFKALAEKYKSR